MPITYIRSAWRERWTIVPTHTLTMWDGGTAYKVAVQAA